MNDIKILDHGYIRFIESWGSDERVIEAARMSTNKGFQGWGHPVCNECGSEISEGKTPHWHVTQRVSTHDGIGAAQCQSTSFTDKPGDEKLLKYLHDNKHASPFEFAGMVVEIQAPLMVFREWHRHRTQSYNEMSARYIPLPNQNYLPEIENLLNRAHAALNDSNKQAATTTTNFLTRDQALIDLGGLYDYYEGGQVLYDRLLAHGWPKELARLPVTVGRYSRMRAQATLRNWLAFLTLRMDPKAQWEIRQYANAIGQQLIRVHFPRTWSLFAEERGFS